MTKEEEEWLLEFFKRPDITRHSPRRKDNIYVGKVDGERNYLQVRSLLWTIKEALNIANWSDIHYYYRYQRLLEKEQRVLEKAKSTGEIPQ